MARCPTNSTDCLLRELIGTQSSYDWSPLNFAFTAILSILGLIIAFVALIQALLAAGPGRLKASKAAIGNSAARTATTRFDWTELRFRTTVQTPEVDITQLLSYSVSTVEPQPFFYAGVSDLDPYSFDPYSCRPSRFYPDVESFPNRARSRSDSGSDSAERRSRKQTTTSRMLRRCRRCRRLLQFSIACVFSPLAGMAAWKKLIDSRVKYPLVDDHEATATWTRLFRHIGAKASDFRSSECKTDSLPADMQAAPAAATIESVIIMSILAGCTSYRTNEYTIPLAIGPQLQLVFREHATLGLVAMYQCYQGLLGIKRRELSETHQACTLALGHLTFHRSRLLEFFCTPPDDRRIAGHFSKLESMITDHHQGCEHRNCKLRDEIVPSWPHFLAQHNSYNQTVALALLFGDKPAVLRLYPAQAVNTQSALKKLSQACNRWPEGSSLLTILEVLNEVTSEAGQLLVFSQDKSEGDLVIDRRQSKLQKHYLKPSYVWHRLESVIPASYRERVSDSSGWLHDPRTPLLRPVRDRFPLSSENTFVGEQKAVGFYTLVAADDDLLISKEALEACIDWNNDPASFSAYTEEKKHRTRNWIAWQLSEIDWWLAHQGGQISLCAALNLMQEFNEAHRGALKGPNEAEKLTRSQVIITGSPVSEADRESGRQREASLQMVVYRPSRDNSHIREDQGKEGNDGRIVVPTPAAEVEPRSTLRPPLQHARAESFDSNYTDTIKPDRTLNNNATNKSAAVPDLSEKQEPAPTIRPRRTVTFPPDESTPSLPENQAPTDAPLPAGVQISPKTDTNNTTNTSTAPSGPSSAPTPNPYAAPDALITAADSRVEAIGVLLVYRAMLFATLLETAIDSSALLRMEQRGRYVLVL